MIRPVCALLTAACVAATANAQQPTQRQLDSLSAQVRALRVRLDSLRAALAAQAGVPAAPPAAAHTGLAALRAPAPAARGAGTTHNAETARRPPVLRGRRHTAQPQPHTRPTHA